MDTHQAPSSPPTNPNQGMTFSGSEQQRTDREHLKILAILHYIYGGLTALAGCAGVIYIAIGAAMVANPSAFDGTNTGNPPPPAWMGSFFFGLGGCIMLMAWALGGLIIYAGRCLTSNRHRILCMVLAGIMCLSVPLGTLLGVFTLIVLARPSVIAMFAQKRMERAMMR